MKKIFFILMILSTTLFGEVKKLSTLTGMKLYVSEELLINKETKKSEYNIAVSFPDKIKKEVVKPDLNKGELFVYNSGEKSIYLPFFKQTTVEKANVNENKMMEFLKSILERDKKDKEFQKNYYIGKLNSIKLDSGETVKMDNFQNFKDYLLPTYIEIYDKEAKVATLTLKIQEVNPTFASSEFQIKK